MSASVPVGSCDLAVRKFSGPGWQEGSYRGGNYPKPSLLLYDLDLCWWLHDWFQQKSEDKGALVIPIIINLPSTESSWDWIWRGTGKKYFKNIHSHRLHILMHQYIHSKTCKVETSTVFTNVYIYSWIIDMFVLSQCYWICQLWSDSHCFSSHCC
jgi:hypothetical protein